MKKILTKFIILETIILLIVLFLITKNYFSNNTIWNLIIHDDQEETLLYENKDSLSNVIVKIYKVEHLSLFDVDIRVDVIFNKLEKYNGCVLADSVGLGKTFTALAVIKYYELRNKSVLHQSSLQVVPTFQTPNQSQAQFPKKHQPFLCSSV